MIERLPTWAGKPWQLLALIALILAPIPASATVFVVNVSEDTQDSVPGDGICADVAGNCSLRAAVQESNAWAGPDTIQLPAGTYTLSIPGNAEHAAATGDLDITQGLTLYGAGATTTIIDAAGIDRIFEVIHANAVSIEGVTLQNGVAGANTPGYFVNQVGGAISNVGDSSSLVLRDVVVRNNSATTGGGIYNIFSTLEIHDSTLHDNQATNGNGGGLSEGLAAFTRLYNVTLSGNRATGDGGGMATSNNTALLNNVTITNNLADSDNDGTGNGGGISRLITAADVSNSIIAGNQDPGGEAPDCSDSLNTSGYNLIGNNAGCSITPAAGDRIGTPGAPLAAGLAPLAQDGGTTPVHAILNGSLALDGGSPGTPGSGSGACEATDQRGNARINVAPCDIGAYEASNTLGLVFNVNSSADLTDAVIGDGRCETVPSGNQCTLRAAIQEANARVGADRINLPAGLYLLSLAGANENAAATGDLDISDRVIIAGAGATSTIIDANTMDRAIEVRMAGGLDISGVTIRNGQVIGSGGGIMHQASGNLSLSDCIVTGNTASSGGGGIFSVAFTTLTIDNCLISGNNAGNYGGGVANFTFSTAFISNTRITGNIANVTGGGLMNSFMSNVIFTNSTIDNNQSQQGGGIGTRWGSGVVTLVNTTVSSNIGTLDGGGIYVAANDILNLRNATLTRNQAQSSANGGGIANYGAVNARNSLVAGNIDIGGEAPDCSGNFTSQGYNLIGDNTGCSLAATTGDLIGTYISPIDARLGPLSYNGGTTPTHTLLIGSPALNSANPATAGNGGASCEALDQRGIDRTLNTPCDIGAVELPNADLAVALTASAGSTEPGATLDYRVSLTNHGPDNAQSIELTFLLPQGGRLNTVAAEDWSCSTAAGFITCTRSAMVHATTSSLDFDVTLGSAAGNWTVTAYATAASLDPVADNDSASLTQTVSASFPQPGTVNIPAGFFHDAATVATATDASGTESGHHEMADSTTPEPATDSAQQETTDTAVQSDGSAAQTSSYGYGYNRNGLSERARQALRQSADSEFASLNGTHNDTHPQPVQQDFHDPALWLALDTMKHSMDSAARTSTLDRDLFIDAAQTAGVFIAAGLTNWYLKSSALLASVLSTLPLWTPFDPLPILALSRREKKKRKAKAAAERDAEQRTNTRLGQLLDPRTQGQPS